MNQSLKEKVAGSQISAAAMEERFARADAKVIELSTAFESDGISEIDSVTQGLEQASGSEGKAAAAAVFKVLHDLKGQGTSFGYPLITRIATDACDYIDSGMDNPSEEQKYLLQLHLSTLKLIFVQRVSGPGGAMEARMIDELARAREKLSGQAG